MVAMVANDNPRRALSASAALRSVPPGRRARRGRLHQSLAVSTALTAAMVAAGAIASELPTGGTVVDGVADIVYGDNSVTIHQGSDRVIIEWDTFNVGQGNRVDFIQEDFMAALNRVLSGGASQILGAINAGGTVVISNPSGVVFGPSASVDVQSIVATSLDIMNSRFMANDLTFDQAGDPTAVVSNAGSITIGEAGLAALVAPGVENSGVIRAQAGTVALASGNAVTIDLYGDGLVQLAVTAPTTAVPERDDGTELDALVTNHPDGAIYADAGSVILTAEAAQGLMDNVINLDGIVVANTIEAVGGQVALVGGQHGGVQVAAEISVLGDDAGEAGGTVHVLGDEVTLADGASIDVSGQAGGGDILIGGDLQGGSQQDLSGLQYVEPAAGGVGTVISTGPVVETGGYIQTAELTYVAAGASAAADGSVDGEGDGDGGTIIVWADDATEFYGSASATGGVDGGDGGFVEVSGAQLAFAGSVDTSAILGNTGWFLLDPEGIRIIDGPDNGSFGAGVSAVVEITDGTLNEFLIHNNILLATADPDAAIGPVPGHVDNRGSGGGPNDDNIIVEAGTNVVTGANTLYFSTTTLDLFADIDGNVAGGLAAPAGTSLGSQLAPLKDPTTVNVYGSGSGGTGSIQDAVHIVGADGTINVFEGTYVESGQILIDQNLTIIGAGSAKPIITPDGDFTTNDAADAWILVEENVTFELRDVVLDGNGRAVWQALRNHGDTTVTRVDFRDILDSANPYRGVAVASFGGFVDGGIGADSHGGIGGLGTSTLLVEDSTFQNIGRIGVIVKGDDASATITGNTYTGKGTGDHLDYAFEVGGGASADILANAISGNRGQARDLSTSAGILVTTFYGDGTTANIRNNVINDSTTAVAVGFDGSDTSDVTIVDNDLSGNDNGVTSTAPIVNASGNWWGLTDELAVRDYNTLDLIDFTPFLLNGGDTDAGMAGFQGDFSRLFVTTEGAQTDPGLAASAVYGTFNATTNQQRINEAVQLAAVDGTVNIGAGTFTESVLITGGVSIVGAGRTDTIIQGIGSGFSIAGSGTSVNLSSLTVQNSPDYGVLISPVADFNLISLDDVAITGNGINGVALRGDPTNGSMVDALSITNSVFTRNGADMDSPSATSLGMGDILAIYYNGDLTLQNVDINGYATGGANFGVQIRGTNTPAAAGTITFDNVTITGSYRRPNSTFGTWSHGGPGAAIAMFTYTDVSNVSFNDVTLALSEGHGFQVDGLTTTLDIGNTTFDVATNGWDTSTFLGQVISGDSIALPSQLVFVGRSSLNPVKTNVDATAAIFPGTFSNFDIEDAVLHALDDDTLGLVTWVADSVFVTQSSGSIQRAIDLASDGWTINVGDGTFTESVIVDKAVSIVGDGIGNTTILQNVGANSVGMTVVNSGVSISGIRFDGNNLADTTGVLVSANGSDVDSTTIQAVAFEELTTALRTEGTGGGLVTDVEVLNSVFEDVNGIVFDIAGGSVNDTFRIFDNRIILADLSAVIMRRPFDRLLDASGNFWGVTDGGSFRILTETEITDRVVDGTGTVVSERLDFTPYLLSGADSDSDLSNGFQGDFSSLFVTTAGGQSGGLGRIQEGIDLVDIGGTVNVGAGTFVDNLLIDKSLTLRGAQAGIDARTRGDTGASILVTATIDPSFTIDSLVDGALIDVQADNVVIDGFILDGDNPALTSGVDLNGSDVDVAGGVFATGNGIEIRNTVIRNLTGVGVYGYNLGGDNVIAYNRFDNITSPARWGRGVILANNFYADVSNNLMTDVRIGIQTNNFWQANPGTNPGVIENNEINATVTGIFHNLFYSNASTIALRNNTINALADPDETTRWVGIALTSHQNTVTTLAEGNFIDGSALNGSGRAAWGFEATNITSPNVTIDGGTLQNLDYGIVATDQAFWHGDVADLTIRNVAFDTIAEFAIYVEDTTALAGGTNPADPADAAAVTVEGGNTFNAVGFALGLSGANATADTSAAGGLGSVFIVGAGEFLFGSPSSSQTGSQIFSAGNGSINNGIAAASAGGTVTIDAGTFTEAVQVDKAVSIVGDGIANTTILRNVGANSVGMTITNSGVSVTGIRFDGNDQANTTGVLVLANGGNVNDTTIQVVAFEELTTAIRTEGGSGDTVSRVTLTNNFFEGITGTVFDFDGGTFTDTFTVFNNRILIDDLSAVLLRRGFDRALDASGNFWGVEDGTGFVALTEQQIADRVIGPSGGNEPDLLDFTPFLTSGADIDSDTSNGFQGDFSELFVTTLGGQTDAATLGRIQEGIDLVSGSTVILGAGTFFDPAQVVIDKDVTIFGQGQGVTNVRLSFDTVDAGDDRGWWLVQPNRTVALRDFTMDGTGQAVYQAIRQNGAGTIDRLTFQNIRFGAYHGMGVAARGSGSVDVTNSVFTNIGRIGAIFFGGGASGSVFSGNTYTGKGVGDHLDYAVEVGGGAANVEITGNQIINNRGVASTDGSVSAGILMSTFNGAGTSAVLSGNTLTDNSTGLFVGFNVSDSSAVTIGAGNVITGGENGMRFRGTDVDIVGDDLNNTVFGGQSGNFVSLELGAEFDETTNQPTIIDATSVDFGGLDITVDADAIQIEQKIVHYLDNGSTGLLRLGGPLVSGESIQLAVNAADLLGEDTVRVFGGVGPTALGGNYGGSVEVWVDDLTVIGIDNGSGGPVIDVGAVDAFANNGDIHTGFLIGAVDATGTNPNDPSGTDPVAGVRIEGFTFAEITPDATPTTGIEIGAAGSLSQGAVVTDNVFGQAGADRMQDAIELVNLGLNRTWEISFNEILDVAVSQHGIFMSDGNLGTGFINIFQNDITAPVDAVHFAGRLSDGGGGVDVRIAENVLAGGDDAVDFANVIHSTGSDGQGPQILISDNALQGGAAAGNYAIETAGLAGTDVLFAVVDNGPSSSATLPRGVSPALGGWGGILVGAAGSDLAIAGNQVILTGQSLIDGARLAIAGNDIDASGGNGVWFEGQVEEGALGQAAGPDRPGERPWVLVGMDPDADFDDLNGRVLTESGLLSFEGDNLDPVGPISLTGNDINAEAVGVDFSQPVSGTDVFVSDSLDTGVVRAQRIVGGTFGIRFASALIEDAVINVVGNDLIEGEGADGISFGLVRTAAIDIADNAAIRGGETGIDFTEVDAGSTVDILRNDEILGRTLHGVAFQRIFDDPAFTGLDAPVVTIANNLDIRGDGGDGVQVSGTVEDDATLSLTGNTIVGQARGVYVAGVLDTASVTFGGGNSVTGGQIGVLVENLQSSTTLSFADETLTGDVSALVVDNTGTTVGTAPNPVGRVVIANSAIFEALTEVDGVVRFLTDADSPGIQVDLTGATNGTTQILGGLHGLEFGGPGIDITNNTLGVLNIGARPASSNGQFIRLLGGAEFVGNRPVLIDASGVTFAGGAPATYADFEAGVTHYNDTGDVGLLNPGDVDGPVTLGDLNSIQLAVNTAGLLGATEVEVDGTRGPFGGSVEVWVDGLTVRADGFALIDVGAVDAFANNGDIDTGFAVGAVDATARNPNDLSGTKIVSDVTITGFTFAEITDDADPTTGIELGIIDTGLGATSISAGAVITNNQFSPAAHVMSDAIELVNIGLNATWQISGNDVGIGAVSRHGIFMSDSNLGVGFLNIFDNTIFAAVDGMHFAGRLSDSGSGVDVLIDGNRVRAGEDAVEFAGLIHSGADDARNDDTGPQVLITGNLLQGGTGTDQFAIETWGLAGTDVLFAVVDNQTPSVTPIGFDDIGLSGQGGIFLRGAASDFSVSGNEIVKAGDSLVDGARFVISGNDVLGLSGNGVTVFGDVEQGSFTRNGGTVTGDRPWLLIGMDQQAIFDDGNGRALTDGGQLSFQGPNLAAVSLSGNDIGGESSGIFFDPNHRVDGADIFISAEPDGSLGTQRIFGGDNGINFSFVGGAEPRIRISGNTLIQGATDDGIDFNLVTGGAQVEIVDNQQILGVNDPDNPAIGGDGIKFEGIGGSETEVVIARNVDIIGLSDGIYFEPVGTGPNADLGIFDGATVLIDLNGTALQTGADYDGSQLVDLDLFDVTGQIRGVAGDGVDFAGLIEEGTLVTVQRNMIVGSGDNGIEVSGIGVPAATTVDGPATLNIFNNFIDGNGTDTSAPQGDGISFQGNFGNALVQVYQNYIIRNASDAVGIVTGVDIGDALTELVDGVDTPANGLFINVNFMPGNGPAAADPVGEFFNAGFGFNNEGTGTPDLNANWWGGETLAEVSAAIDGFTLAPPFFIVTDPPGVLPAEDANTDILALFPRADTGLVDTPLFAFQPLEIALLEFPVDLGTLDLLDFFRRFGIPTAEFQNNNPGGDAFFTSEQGVGFQTNLFADGNPIGSLGGGPQPAGGGGNPLNIGDIEPAAGGPGSDGAEADDTCVATYLQSTWDYGDVCQ